MTTTLVTLEPLVKAYAAARAVLSKRVSELETIVAMLHRRKLPGIKSALSTAQDAQAALTAAISAHQEIFENPRTQTLHGIKFGFRKGSGKISWEDDDAVVARIEKLFLPEQAATLIQIRKKPISAAIKELDVKTLARLGIDVESTGNTVFVKAQDGGVDKLVKKILKEGAVGEEG